MKIFTYHTIESAPKEAANVLADIHNVLGFVPNIFAIVAESTLALKGLVAINDAFTLSSFSAEEQQIFLMLDLAKLSFWN